MELPIFEHLSHERSELSVAAPVPLAPLGPAAVPQPTEELLREFETVYGVVELTHLTPPQSPPGPATQLLLSYAQAQQLPLAQPLSQPQPHWDLERQLQDVDELVRHRAAQLASPQPYAPSTASSSAPSSPHSTTDEDWSAAPVRSKPYARASDDRRSRKKEQNKNAATRYRQKKKAEVEVLLSEESELRARHGELGNKCADLQREIRYLKGLMRDLFKAKGLIK